MSVIRRKIYTDSDLVTQANQGEESLFVVSGGKLVMKETNKEAEEVSFEELAKKFREKRNQEKRIPAPFQFKSQ